MTDTFKLSSAQRDIFFDQISAPHSPMYNVGGYLLMPNNASYDRFKVALETVIEYFDVFHVKFIQRGDDVRQYVDRMNPYTIQLLDFSSQKDAEASAFSYVDKRMAKPFGMLDENLVEIGIIRVSSTKFVPFARCHHAIIDGVGFANLIEKVSHVYNDDDKGLGEASFQAAVEADDVTIKEKTRDYWLSRMGDLSTTPVKRSSSRQADSTISEISQKAYEFFDTKSHLFSTNLLTYYSGAAAWVMANIFDEDTVCLALPSHRRRSKTTKGTIAQYASVSPMMYHFDKAQTVAQFIGDINRQLKESYRHISITSSQISSIISKNGDSGIYDIVFNYSKIAMDKRFGDGIAKAVLRMPKASSAPLRFVLQEYGTDNVKIELAHHTDVLTVAQAKKVLNAINNVVEAFISSANKRVASIACFDEIKSLSKAPDVAGFRECIQQSFERHAQEQAVRIQGTSYSYLQINEMIARNLDIIKQSTIPNSCVAVVGETSVDFIAKLIAIIIAKRAFAILDSTWGNETVFKAVKDIGGYIWEQDTISTQNPTTRAIYQDTAYVVFTSGSTGKPKAVKVSDNNLSHYLSGALDVYAREVNNAIVVSNPSFDLTLPGLLIPFMKGGELVLANDVHDVDASVDALLNYAQPAFVRVTPSHLLSLLKLSDRSSSAVRTFVVGGEAFPANLYAKIKGCFNSSVVLNHYGPSEATIGALYSWVDTDALKAPDLGTSFDHVSYCVVNRFGHPPLTGRAGELLIGGLGLTDGYINEDNTSVFIKDVAGESWYKTGDLVSVDGSGKLRFAGRKGRHLKIKGVRVDVSSLEASLVALMGGCRYWIGSTDGVDRLVIVIESSADLSDLQNAIEAHLPVFLYPILIGCPLLPANARGKLDSGRIQTMANKEVDRLMSALQIESASETESVLLDMWMGLVSSEKRCVVTHFFDLGGNSLHLTKLSALIRERFEISLTVEDIYQNTNIRKLAKKIDDGIKSKSLIDAVKADGDTEYTGEIIL